VGTNSQDFGALWYLEWSTGCLAGVMISVMKCWVFDWRYDIYLTWWHKLYWVECVLFPMIHTHTWNIIDGILGLFVCLFVFVCVFFWGGGLLKLPSRSFITFMEMNLMFLVIINSRD
jgi:hypothetical protein